jgi:hypothetical protein
MKLTVLVERIPKELRRLFSTIRADIDTESADSYAKALFSSIGILFA